MTITTTSERGRVFLRGHEGNPLTCYLDPVKVPTIGTGFTMGSAAVRRALAKIGITKLVPGKTKITAAQSDAILLEVLAEEFEPAVVKKSPVTRTQGQMDASTSAVFNLGTGAMDWTWADLWRAGKVREAADYLSSHYNTAKGKKLAGLVRRRREEAAMFLSGAAVTKGEGVIREATETKPAIQDPVVREAQEVLKSQGIDPGKVDGWMGAKTEAAIKAYQRAHPHLVADGKLGAATLAQLRRDAATAKELVTKGLSSAAGSGVLAFAAGFPWAWVAAGVAVVVVGYIAYRNRDIVVRRWNTWRGREAVV
jgi:GH24 family phage-related lysozyme (muramidase)